MREKLFYLVVIICIVFAGCRMDTAAVKEQKISGDVEQVGSGQIQDRQQPITLRSSSTDPDWVNGNGDCRGIKAGETLTLAQLEGPGRINHIWSTIAAFDRYYPRHLVLRIYWDQSDQPAVEAPIGDFFAAGHGMLKDVTSRMVAVSSYGRSYNCYWKMPFRESAKITLTNDSKLDVMCVFWYVDYEKRAVAPDEPYFHAQYRQENTVHQESDYLVFDGLGQGYYAGTVLSVRMSMPGWFGEGDDRFYIDGSDEPVLKGTGTEDYFCDAWAFRELNRPYYGVSIWEGMFEGSRCSAYRWHVEDPVYFDESMRFTIEHKGNTFDSQGKMVSGYTPNRPDFYSSVAFWYQTGRAKRFGSVPPLEERLPEYKLLESEELIDTAGDPQLSVVDAFTFSGDKCVHFENKQLGGGFEIPFEVDQAGDYAVFLGVCPFAWGGIYDFFLDGKLIRSFDSYCEHCPVVDVKLGHVQKLGEGRHVIRAVCKGANDWSFDGQGNKGYMLRVDYVALEKVGIGW